jgi:hypothetical protein
MLDLTPEETGLETELTPEVTPKEQPTPTIPASVTPKPAAAPEDPELDLGLDEKGQPLKFKRSQLLEYQKSHSNKTEWEKSNTVKAQEIAAEKEQLKEMFGIVEHLKANPKKAERIIAILDEKEQAAEQKIDDIDEVLKDLPADDPYAKTLRALKAQNQQLLKTTQELSTKLGAFEQTTKTVQEQENVKQATSFLTKALDDAVKGLEFADDDDKADWRNAVLTYLVNNPGKYPTEQDFLKAIQTAGAAQFEALTKRNERIQARYIKSKGGTQPVSLHPAGGGAKPLSKKPTMETLQESIEEALTNEAGQNKE